MRQRMHSSQQPKCCFSRRQQTSNYQQQRRSCRRMKVIARGETDDFGGMNLPLDSFGGISAEEKASQALISMATFAAVRIVMAQEESYDNEGGAAASW